MKCSWAKEAYSPCGRMCSKAQALRKERRDEDKAAADRRAQEQTKQYQKETAANARRVLLAAEAAGLPEKKYIDWGYSGGATVERLREYAGGVFPEGERWHEAKFSPQRLTDPAKTAKQLGCSTDYLLGLTNELTPAGTGKGVQEDVIPAEMVETLLEEMQASAQDIHPVWLPGVPEKSGPVAARLALDGCTKTLVDLFWYDASLGKYLFRKGGETIEAECTGWWPVPEEDSNADDQ